MSKYSARRYNRAGGTRHRTIQAGMRRTEFTQLAVPVVGIALISVMYYATQDQLVWLHNILQHLYFRPHRRIGDLFRMEGRDRCGDTCRPMLRPAHPDGPQRRGQSRGGTSAVKRRRFWISFS